MSKENVLKNVSIFTLILSFPALWYYNQKINYRTFLQVDKSMLLIGADEKKSDLSSTVEIINLLKPIIKNATLSPKPVATSEFGVLGRILETDYGPVEIYEYAEVKTTIKYLETVKDPNTIRYRNFLIRNSLGEPKLAGVINEVIK